MILTTHPVVVQRKEKPHCLALYIAFYKVNIIQKSIKDITVTLKIKIVHIYWVLTCSRLLQMHILSLCLSHTNFQLKFSVFELLFFKEFCYCLTVKTL